MARTTVRIVLADQINEIFHLRFVDDVTDFDFLHSLFLSLFTLLFLNLQNESSTRIVQTKTNQICSYYISFVGVNNFD